VGAAQGSARARNRGLHTPRVVGRAEGNPGPGGARPVPGPAGAGKTAPPRFPGYLRGHRPVHALGRDLHDLPARGAHQESPPPYLRAELRCRGPDYRGAGDNRQPGVGRQADSRPGFPGSAGHHAVGRSGLLSRPGPRLDPVVRRPRLEIRLRRGPGMLRRPGRAHIRGGNRPVVGSADELGLFVAGRVPPGQQLRCAFAADARPRGDGIRHRSRLFRHGRGAAHRERPRRHDRVLSGGGEVSPGRAPQVRCPGRPRANARTGCHLPAVR